MSLVDLVRQNLGPDGVQDISRQLGADPATTQRAIDAALPMLAGGMASTAAQPGGEGTMQGLGALGGGGAGGALGGLGDLLGGGGAGSILGSILGQDNDAVQDDVSKASGLDRGKVVQLLILLAPIVLRALQNQQGSAQPGAPSAGQQEDAPSGGMGGALGKILDGLGR